MSRNGTQHIRIIQIPVSITPKPTNASGMRWRINATQGSTAAEAALPSLSFMKKSLFPRLTASTPSAKPGAACKHSSHQRKRTGQRRTACTAAANGAFVKEGNMGQTKRNTLGVFQT
jgi:hypothetical protein